MHVDFWTSIIELVKTCEVVIDRARGTAHPRLHQFIYPLDYGYLCGTTSGDGEGIDIWIGTGAPDVVTGIYFTIDGRKKDMEAKILLGCSKADTDAISDFFGAIGLGFILIEAP